MADAFALEHMTGLHRGGATWVAGSAVDVILEDGVIRLDQTPAGAPVAGLIARLHKVGDTYEIEAKGAATVWVNGSSVTQQTLRHGDTVEFGETGPLCRLRVYKGDPPYRNSAADIVSDVATYLRVSRQRPAKRIYRAGSALVGRLSRETSLLFRITVLLVLLGFGWLFWQQYQLNRMLQSQIAQTSAGLDRVSSALVEAEAETLRPGDLEALRESFEARLESSASRLEELEQRSTAAERVIGEAARQIVFIQGMYGFREAGGERLLRQAVTPEGVPMLSFRGRPLLTFDGEGPVVELQFAGTGFFLGPEAVLVTNRHVALPWEKETGIEGIGPEQVEPVMLRLVVYVQGRAGPVAARLERASEQADLAVLAPEGIEVERPGLALAEDPPRSGEEVVVMGYPTGLRSLLARSGAEFIAGLQARGVTDFWGVAEELSRAGFIAPLSSRGIVAQATGSAIVYDADTTHGGSGGPVLDMEGAVVAVNSAIIPEYGGSNLGVPAEVLRTFLAETGAY